MMWQWEILRWAKDTFGPIATDRKERASRFVEEATELGQAAGIDKARMLAIVERVYSRPAGDVRIEIAQAGMTLAAFASNEAIELELAIGQEYMRVKEIGKDYWNKRQREKADQGIGGKPA